MLYKIAHHHRAVSYDKPTSPRNSLTPNTKEMTSVVKPEVANLQEFYFVPTVRAIQWLCRLLFSVKRKCIRNIVPLKRMSKFSRL